MQLNPSLWMRFHWTVDLAGDEAIIPVAETTVFELAGQDKAGLLADVTDLLSANDCLVRSAAVSFFRNAPNTGYLSLNGHPLWECCIQRDSALAIAALQVQLLSTLLRDTSFLQTRLEGIILSPNIFLEGNLASAINNLLGWGMTYEASVMNLRIVHHDCLKSAVIVGKSFGKGQATLQKVWYEMTRNQSLLTVTPRQLFAEDSFCTCDNQIPVLELLLN